MTTTRDVVTGAYRRLGLLPLGAELDPDRAAAGLAAYNDMLNAWAADGIFPGGPKLAVWQTDGDYIGGDLINGGIQAGAGAFPPYGPSDAASPPAASSMSLGFDAEFPFAPQFVEGTKALLAVELASQSGIEPLPSVQKRARKAHEALLAYYVVAPRAGQDAGLAWMPSLRRYGSR
jgi:hypothetical protein